MKNYTTKFLSLLAFCFFASASAFASHNQACVSDIDHTGNGTFSGNYTHSNSDHTWFVFDAVAGDVITISYATGFNSYWWIYKSNGATIQVGDCPGSQMTNSVKTNGGFTESEIPSSATFTYTIPAGQGGQYAMQMDAYLGGSGTYSVTISGATGGCPGSASFKLYGLNNLWKNAGANDENTFYYGVTQSKRIRANVSGGVGPYTYTWSNSQGYQMKFQIGNQIRLYEPDGPSWVICEVTDQGAACTFKDSVFVDWSDEYWCGSTGGSPADFWKLEMCQSGTTVCMSWGAAKTALQNATATLGACVIKTSKNITQGQLISMYPNPTAGSLTLNFESEKATSGTLVVLDVNGRLLQSESLQLTAGVSIHNFELNNLPNGMYMVRLTTDNDVFTERIQLMR